MVIIKTDDVTQRSSIFVQINAADADKVKKPNDKYRKTFYFVTQYLDFFS